MLPQIPDDHVQTSTLIINDFFIFEKFCEWLYNIMIIIVTLELN